MVGWGTHRAALLCVGTDPRARLKALDCSELFLWWASGQVEARSVQWVVTDTNTFIREIPWHASQRLPAAEGTFNYYFN